MTFNTGDVHISEFSILGLHGNKNIRLKLEDNTLILVGENGTHKTTILTLFYSFLAGDVPRLAKYIFDTLEMVINGETYLYDVKDAKDSLLNAEQLEELDIRLPPNAKRFIREEKSISLQDLRDFLKEDGAPSSYIKEIYMKFLTLGTSNSVFNDVRKAFEKKPCHFLYLPTYRRIEEELQNIRQRNRYSEKIEIYSNSRELDRLGERRFDREQSKRFKNLDLNDSLVCQELVEFGMKDIQKLWSAKLTDLKEKATQGVKTLDKEYIEDLLVSKHDSINENTLKDLDETNKKRVLERIEQEESISPALQIQFDNLLSGKIDNKQVVYFFKKRYELYVKLFEYEESLKALCTACNRYLHSNEIVFDPTKLDVYIRNRKTSESSPEQRIELSQLSSGEKQLVSLFTHLYLAEGKQYFLIIDEPEISLSVEWQETFLEDIRNGTFCSGLFVATHSPFMFDNSLRKYAHGVGRFLEVVEPSDDKQ